jgi:hypothetical protein
MAVILAGSAPKQIGENVLDIQPTLSSRARAREKWRGMTKINLAFFIKAGMGRSNF